MKKILISSIILMLALWAGKIYATEHGGAAPSSDDIHSAMSDYIQEHSAETGTFDVIDPLTQKTRHLTLERIHERVGKTGENYYSCADFKDKDSGEMLDLDIDVENKNNQLNVVNVQIHKINGKERYAYDENDNRIPVPQEVAAAPVAPPPASQQVMKNLDSHEHAGSGR